jgi:Holliday junction DNA helicase RuvA
MLRFLSGKVVSVFDTLVVLDVNGMGFELLCTGRGAEMCREGENALLVTHLQFSEAGPSLFGFADDRERDLFLKLTTVKGVGGKNGDEYSQVRPCGKGRLMDRGIRHRLPRENTRCW